LSRLKQSRQKAVKGNLTPQTLQVNAFLPSNILKPVLRALRKAAAVAYLLGSIKRSLSEKDFAVACCQLDVSYSLQFRSRE
jgi:hypothetical protein